MLTGLTKAIDPFFEKARAKLTEVCKPLKIYKNKIKSVAHKKKMFRECDGYFMESLVERGEKGSDIILGYNRKILAAINSDENTYELLEDVRHRSRAYTTHISRYGDICHLLAQNKKQLFKKIKLTRKQSDLERARKLDTDISHDKLSTESKLCTKYKKTYLEESDKSVTLEDATDVDTIIEEGLRDKYRYMV